jgi:thymidylate kinase
MGVAFVDEEAEAWTELGFLAGLYQGTLSPAAFQNTVLSTNAANLSDCIGGCAKPKIVITERSVFSNYHVFGKATLSGMEARLLKFTFDRVTAPLLNAEFRFLYMDVQPEIAMKRIEERGREGEGEISLKYVQRISELHSEWLDEAAKTSHVARVDATQSQTEVVAECLALVEKWVVEVATEA